MDRPKTTSFIYITSLAISQRPHWGIYGHVRGTTSRDAILTHGSPQHTCTHPGTCGNIPKRTILKPFFNQKRSKVVQHKCISRKNAHLLFIFLRFLPIAPNQITLGLPFACGLNRSDKWREAADFPFGITTCPPWSQINEVFHMKQSAWPSLWIQNRWSMPMESWLLKAVYLPKTKFEN